MRISARATMDPTVISSFNVPRGQGFLVLQLGEEYRPRMLEQVAALVKRQKEKHAKATEKWNAIPPEQRGLEPRYQDSLLDLELELTIHYQKRSLDQNALSWSLYEIEANFFNGTSAYRFGYDSKFLPGHVITPMEIHDADVDVYSEKKRYRIHRRERLAFDRGMRYAELGRLWGEPRDVPGFPDLIEVVVAKTTQFLTTVEMSEWTKRQIQRIVDNGLLKSDESRFLGIKQDLMEIIEGKRRTKL
jgi:hypothetical protein